MNQEATAPVDLSKVVAIIVEDDSSGLAFMNIMLRRLKIQAYIDPSGKNVVQIALDLPQPPDLILLDINLPGQTGFDVFQQIRTQPTLTNVPVVGISAMDAAVMTRRCKELGFNGFIAKPIQSRYFAEQIQKVLGGGQVWDETWMVR